MLMQINAIATINTLQKVLAKFNRRCSLPFKFKKVHNLIDGFLETFLTKNCDK